MFDPVSDPKGAAQKYRSEMAHHYWVVRDGKGKVVAEGLKDAHAARQWIEDHCKPTVQNGESDV
jgi:hypothetical protein